MQEQLPKGAMGAKKFIIKNTHRGDAENAEQEQTIKQE